MIEKHCMCPSTVLSLAPIFCWFFRLLFILFLSFVSPCHSAGTLHVDWIALHVPFNFSVSRTQLSSLIKFIYHWFSPIFQPISFCRHGLSFHHLFDPLLCFTWLFIMFSANLFISSSFQPVVSFRHCYSSVFNPFIIFSPSFSPFLHVIMASAWLFIVVSARFFISPLFLIVFSTYFFISSLFFLHVFNIFLTFW